MRTYVFHKQCSSASLITIELNKLCRGRWCLLVVGRIQRCKKLKSRGKGVAAINKHFIEMTNDFSYCHINLSTYPNTQTYLLILLPKGCSITQKKGTVNTNRTMLFLHACSKHYFRRASQHRLHFDIHIKLFS